MYSKTGRNKTASFNGPTKQQQTTVVDIGQEKKNRGKKKTRETRTEVNNLAKNSFTTKNDD